VVDLVIVLAFVAYAVTAGMRARRRASRSLEEYFLAGRSLPGWKAGTSMAATQFAADTPLLVTGLVATAGVFALWRLWIYGLAFLLMAFVFSALWRRAGVLTDAELTELRYSGRGVLPLRVLKAVYYGTVINCVVMAMVLVAAVRIAEVFLPWHAWLPAAVFEPLLGLVARSGLVIASGATGIELTVATTNNLISIATILTFTAAYSTTGGLRSVVTTDIAQFTLAIAGTLVYAWVVVHAAGGLDELGRGIGELYGADAAGRLLSFAPGTGEVLLPFLVLIGMQWLFQMNSDGTGYLAQRSMACATDRDARFAGVLFAWLQILLRSVPWLLIAVGLLVLYPFDPAATAEPAGAARDAFAASREILFVTGIQDLLPAGVRGLMLTGLLAALASTLDTHLNWGASYWSRDIYHRLISEAWLKREPGRRELVLVARLSNLLILAIALVIMANLGSIQTAWFLSLLFGAGMGSVLVLRWLWERINMWSEIAAMATSLLIAPVLLVTIDAEWVRLGVMALTTTAAAIGVTWLTPATDAAVLGGFYERVRPVGFWRATARSLGEAPAVPLARLRGGLAAAGLTAVSLFLLLYGVAAALVRSPHRSGVWPLAALLLGATLVPLWWRRLDRHDLHGGEPGAAGPPGPPAAPAGEPDAADLRV
jgi:solute:Na+ symporter, SSS family